MKLTLVRFAYLEECTLGWLTAGSLRLATIERPWLPNPSGIPGGKPRESCVPDAVYNVRPHSSEKFPDTYALVNHSVGIYYQPFEVPNAGGRSAILIHAGNRVRDIIGCIAVGQNHGWMTGEHAVLPSQVALKQLREVLGQDHHVLDIRATAGTREAA